MTGGSGHHASSPGCSHRFSYGGTKSKKNDGLFITQKTWGKMWGSINLLDRFFYYDPCYVGQGLKHDEEDHIESFFIGNGSKIMTLPFEKIYFEIYSRNTTFIQNLNNVALNAIEQKL